MGLPLASPQNLWSQSTNVLATVVKSFRVRAILVHQIRLPAGLELVVRFAENRRNYIFPPIVLAKGHEQCRQALASMGSDGILNDGCQSNCYPPGSPLMVFIEV